MEVEFTSTYAIQSVSIRTMKELKDRFRFQMSCFLCNPMLSSVLVTYDWLCMHST